MSAANLFWTPGAAYLMADSAAFVADGRIARLTSKIVSCTRLGIAVSISGTVPEDANATIMGWLSAQRDADVAIVALPHLLREIEGNGDFDAGGLPRGINLHVASWSRRHHRPECCVIGCEQHKFGQRYAPRTVKHVSLSVSPSVDQALYPDVFDPTLHLMPIAKAQRVAAFECGAYRVGGQIELATVSATGVTIETAHDWRDRVGEYIEPNARWAQRLSRLFPR